jgi:GNAT superfamily N-acetyltransferase
LGFLPPLSADVARDYWLTVRRDLQAGTRLLLGAFTDDGVIVGSGQLSFPPWPNARHRAELQKLFVWGALRGMGVGRLLMTALHEAARDRGRSLILLNTRRGGPEGFYKGLGYKEIGVVPGFFVGASGERYDTVSYYQELSS